MSSTGPIISPGIAKRIDGIDLLRGMAIFLVVMNHVNMRLYLAKVPYTHGLPQQLVKSLFWDGQFGVQMFFAVSGFLITSITLRRWGSLSQVSLRGFYRLRMARIAPLLLLLLAVLSVLHFAHVHDFVVSAKTGGLGRALLAALTFHINVLEARRGYLPGNWDILWSLSVEEMFYLFFPLICRLFGQGKLLVALLLGFVALGPFGRTVFAHGSGTWEEYSYLGGMEAIALGCLTALIVSRFPIPRRLRWVISFLGGALVVFMLGFSLEGYRLGLGRYGLDMSVLAVGTCMVIAVSADSQWKSSRLLSPLLKIGQYSYEVYLTHMFVVFAFFDLFVATGKPMRLVPVLFVVVVLVAGLLGGIVAHFYSEPMNRLLRKRSPYESTGLAPAANVPAGQATESQTAV
jgi:peptidoglycan/LPS O-acetylase OafA/YrhL